MDVSVVRGSWWSMDDDIPELRPLEDLEPLVSDRDLHAFWRMIKGPFGFSEPQAFAVVIDGEGRPIPGLINVKEWPQRFESELCESLAERLAEVIEGYELAVSCAVMWARPGEDVFTPLDRQWCHAFVTALRDRGLGRWPVHRANDHRVRTVTGDDLDWEA